MTIMMTELYDALRSAEGVSDEQARRAAEAVAAFDDRFVGLERRMDRMQADLERRFDTMQSEMDRRFETADRRIDAVQIALERRMDSIKVEMDLKIEDLRGTMRVMQWMLATLVAGVAAIIVKIYAV